MRRVDTDSWRLSTSFGNSTLHAALFIRDAFHLKPEHESSLPPRLTGGVPNVSALVPGFDPFEAALQWASWWERVVTYEAAVALGEFRGSDDGDSLGDMAAARARVFDPPNFLSMSDAPSLRSLAQGAHREALRWSKYRSSRSNPALQRGTRDSVVTRVAWETCVALHVKPSQLSATVIVLDVEGSWRSFPRAGLLLCSANVFRKEPLFEKYLRETFLENLGLRDTEPAREWSYDDIMADGFDFNADFDESDTLRDVHQSHDLD
ncbi:MAG: hypothetical protein JWM55_338 [Acidimicrobiaceae bacterium]|nr:hypothetical protein [Acidimicrobiaceae bacterium]